MTNNTLDTAENESHQLQPKKAFSIDPNNLTDFYIRAYQGGRTRELGHEFLEFDVRYDCASADHGILRYANQSNYRNEELIRKEVAISKLVVKQIAVLVQESEILMESDERWPKSQYGAKTEVEIRCGKQRAIFRSIRLGGVGDCKSSDDPEGLKVFFYFSQNLRAFIFSLISLHFKVRPV